MAVNERYNIVLWGFLDAVKNQESKYRLRWIPRQDDFFAETSVADLIKAQKVKPFNDISDLAGGIPADEDIDEFLEGIYFARR